MTLSRRKLLQRGLLASPLISGNVLLCGAASAVAEPVTQPKTDTSVDTAAEAAPAFMVRAGESRTGTPWTVEGVPHFWDKISGSDVGGRLSVIEVTTPAGAGPPMHVHLAQNEWMFLLSGRFGVQCGSKRVVLNAGDSFMAPSGAPHAYVVLGTQLARHLNIYDPAGEIEAFFADYDHNWASPPSHDPIVAAERERKIRSRS